MLFLAYLANVKPGYACKRAKPITSYGKLLQTQWEVNCDSG